MRQKKNYCSCLIRYNDFAFLRRKIFFREQKPRKKKNEFLTKDDEVKKMEQV